MKYLTTFEKFKFPFFNKKEIKKSEIDEPIDEPFEEIDEPFEEPLQEIQVSWTGGYDYNGKHYMLEIDDITNKGIIKNIVKDIHHYYITTQGSFNPNKLKVVKGNQEQLDQYVEDLEMRSAANTYNL
jgi:hypothetical protein